MQDCSPLSTAGYLSAHHLAYWIPNLNMFYHNVYPLLIINMLILSIYRALHNNS